jgi:hypothetical protein
MSQIVLTADNTGSATAGALEYDGRVVYATPQGTQRGVIPGAQFYRINADYVGTTATTAQSIFGSGVTLSSNTIYAFETIFILQKTVSATSHTISIGFGGSATINNILYENYGGGITQAALPVLLDTLNYSSVNTVSATNTIGTVSSANRIQTMRMTGTVSIGTGGTFIPQYTISAAVGPYSTTAGSYFYIYPLGVAGGNISVGAWS